jgi:release factor glutamine methyltransferase
MKKKIIELNLSRAHPIYDAGEGKVFYLILEEKQKLKRIDLALQPDLFF